MGNKSSGKIEKCQEFRGGHVTVAQSSSGAQPRLLRLRAMKDFVFPRTHQKNTNWSPESGKWRIQARDWKSGKQQGFSVMFDYGCEESRMEECKNLVKKLNMITTEFKTRGIPLPDL